MFTHIVPSEKLQAMRHLLQGVHFTAQNHPPNRVADTIGQRMMVEDASVRNPSVVMPQKVCIPSIEDALLVPGRGENHHIPGGP
jgi:hypothetical protein